MHDALSRADQGGGVENLGIQAAMYSDVCKTLLS